MSSAAAIISLLLDYGIVAAVRYCPSTARVSITTSSGHHYDSIAQCIARHSRNAA